jgi:hypothetical protein
MSMEYVVLDMYMVRRHYRVSLAASSLAADKTRHAITGRPDTWRWLRYDAPRLRS